MASTTFFIIVVLVLFIHSDCINLRKVVGGPLTFLPNSTFHSNPPQQCIDLKENIKDSMAFQDLSGPELAENIDDACENFTKMAACMKVLKSYVDTRSKINLDVALETWDFLCTVDGKSGIKLFYESQCHANETLKELYEEKLKICKNETEETSEGDESFTEGSNEQKDDASKTASEDDEVTIETSSEDDQVNIKTSSKDETDYIETMSEEEVADICAILLEAEECVYKVTNEMCGEKLAQFNRGLTRASHNAMPIYGTCFLSPTVEINVKGAKEEL